MTSDLCVIMAACAIWLPAGHVQAQQAPTLASAQQATVTVQTDKGTGSAFFVRSHGIAVTAAHVMANAKQGRVVLPSGQTLPIAGMLHYDASSDLAIIKVHAVNLPHVALGNSDDVRVGQRIIAIGSPFALPQSVTDGVLSSTRVIDGRRLLQVSVPISPGNSGGPILTERAEVIGVAVAGIRGGGAENLNFALPSSYVIEILSHLDETNLTSLDKMPETLPWSDVQKPRRIDVDSDIPGAVNSLPIDFAALSGTQVYSELGLENNFRQRTLVTYTTGVSALGADFFERHDNTIVELRTWSYRPFYQYDTRTELILDGSRLTVQYQGAPRDQNAPSPGSYSVRIRDGQAEVSTNGQMHSSGTVPSGVLTPEMIPAFIAAMPDSLPRMTHVWVLTSDSTTSKVEPVRIEFGRTQRVTVPVIADENESCGPRAPTRKAEMDAVVVKWTVRATVTEYAVLKSAPHLGVGDDLKCVRLPDRMGASNH